MRSRPHPVTAAVIVLALFSLVGLPVSSLPGAEEPPAFILYWGIVVGIVGLAAAVGLWMLKKWGFWLTIVVSVLDFLLAAPGLVLGLDPVSKVRTMVGVGVPALIIVLVVRPDSRRAFATSSS